MCKYHTPYQDSPVHTDANRLRRLHFPHWYELWLGLHVDMRTHESVTMPCEHAWERERVTMPCEHGNMRGSPCHVNMGTWEGHHVMWARERECHHVMWVWEHAEGQPCHAWLTWTWKLARADLHVGRQALDRPTCGEEEAGPSKMGKNRQASINDVKLQWHNCMHTHEGGNRTLRGRPTYMYEMQTTRRSLPLPSPPPPPTLLPPNSISRSTFFLWEAIYLEDNSTQHGTA